MVSPEDTDEGLPAPAFAGDPQLGGETEDALTRTAETIESTVETVLFTWTERNIVWYADRLY
jgi:hypothetical protein